MTTVLSEDKPRARREHRCSSCEGTISSGEVYIRQVCVYDNLYVWKTHLLCDAIYWRLWREQDLYEDEQVEPSEIRDSLVEFFSAFNLGRAVWPGSLRSQS